MKILLATAGSAGESSRNMNLYQRIRFLGETEDLDLLVRREAEIDPALAGRANVYRPRARGTWPFLLLTAWRSLRGHGRYDVLVTDRSAASLVGWATTRASRLPWAVDLWDSPEKEVTTFYRDCRGLRCRVRRLASQLKVLAFRRVLRRADLVLLSILPRALERYRIPPERVRTFRNAIDLDLATTAGERRGPRGSETTVCIANSLFLPDRGLATLVEAVELLATEDEVRPRVALAGRLPPGEAGTIDRSPSRAVFDVRGPVSLREMLEIMAASDIGVIPFLDNADVANTYPVKLFEYMAAGCVVVASNLPSIAAIVEHERNGLLVPPGDARALAAAIRRLATGREVLERLRDQAARDVRAYDWRLKGEAVVATIRSLQGRDGR